MMRKYIIEREIPKIGTFEREQLREAAKTSNAALAKLAPDVQWVESFVADDKTFCVYLATDGDGPPPRRDQRVPGDEDHRDKAHDRSDDGVRPIDRDRALSLTCRTRRDIEELGRERRLPVSRVQSFISAGLPMATLARPFAGPDSCHVLERNLHFR